MSLTFFNNRRRKQTKSTPEKPAPAEKSKKPEKKVRSNDR